MSLSGFGYNRLEFNRLWILKNKDIKIFVSSGNNKLNLDKGCIAFPSCYSGLDLTVVGSRDKFANTGDVVDIYEEGCFEDMCGTSISTAIATGKYVRRLK
jgi:hypothetical protein